MRKSHAIQEHAYSCTHARARAHTQAQIHINVNIKTTTVVELSLYSKWAFTMAEEVAS